MKKLCILLAVFVVNIYALDIPSLYQCKGVQLVSTDENGNNKTKSFGMQDFYIKFDYNQINVYGNHSGKSLCKSLTVDRIFSDTIFLKTSAKDFRELGNKDIKFYMNKDTLISNHDFLYSTTNQTCIKVLITKIGVNREPGIKRLCK
ncbi:MAG: hypothetical protein Q4F84_00485 [Fibrobacter sp.]|nr:hypothetical protein [Fibrobacter sp.]